MRIGGRRGAGLHADEEGAGIHAGLRLACGREPVCGDRQAWLQRSEELPPGYLCPALTPRPSTLL